MSRKKRSKLAAAEPRLETGVQIGATQGPDPVGSSKPKLWRLALVLGILLVAQSVLTAYLFLRRSTGTDNIKELTELEKVLSLPDPELERVSITRINLLVAKEILPDLNIAHYEEEFDRLVQGLKSANLKHGANASDPDKLIRVLNTYLYFDKKFKYARLGNSTDPSLLSLDPSNLFLHGILEKMQGTCISMPVLYIALGEAMGYPIKGVNAGDHFFCRWVAPNYVSNIEPTGGGGWSPDEDYIRDMKVTKAQLDSGAYMRSLTKRELIGNFFFARASHLAVTGGTLCALEDFYRVIACNPRDVDGYANLANLSARWSNMLGKHADISPQFSYPGLGGMNGMLGSMQLPPKSAFPLFDPTRPQSPYILKLPTVPNPQDLVPDPTRNIPGFRRQP